MHVVLVIPIGVEKIVRNPHQTSVQDMELGMNMHIMMVVIALVPVVTGELIAP